MPKKKEEPVFVEPDFNEIDFMKEERERSKSVIAVFVIGAIIGLLSGYLDYIGLWYFSVLLIFIFLLFLKFILNALRIELPKRTTHKILVGGVFVLTWLLFWILFLNQPLHLVSGPQISDLQYQDQGVWAPVKEPKTNVYNLIVTDHNVRLYINYKYNITGVSILEAPAGNEQSTTPITSHLSGNYIYFNLTGSLGQQNAKIITVQAHSAQASSTYKFTVSFVQAPPTASTSVYQGSVMSVPVKSNAGVV